MSVDGFTEQESEDFGFGNIPDEGENTDGGSEAVSDNEGDNDAGGDESDLGNEQQPTDEGEKPPKEELGEDGKPKKVPEQPDFAKASENALFNDKGVLDTGKITDYFVSKGKSFLKFDSHPEEAKPVKSDEKIVDPEKEYVDSVNTVINSWNDVVNDLITNRKMTHEQAVAAIGQHFASLAQQRDAKVEISKTRQKYAADFEAELQTVRDQKITTRIESNTTELAAQCEGLVPNVDGRTALNNFVLGKDFGAPWVDYLFKRDNPGVDKLPEAERSAKVASWFRGFQANRREFALVAEVGKLRWLVGQLPGITEHAKKVGAGLAKGSRETRGGKPSSMVPSRSGKQSTMEQFLGAPLDSVI
jgi:hypothetical protein